MHVKLDNGLCFLSVAAMCHQRMLDAEVQPKIHIFWEATASEPLQI